MSLAQQVQPISLRLSIWETVLKEEIQRPNHTQAHFGRLREGSMGLIVAKIFQGASDRPVIAYNPYMSTDAWPKTPLTRITSLDSLTRQADIMTVRVPPTPDTKNLIGHWEMELMERERNSYGYGARRDCTFSSKSFLENACLRFSCRFLITDL
jgi:phosphoglycerate dehydrogenase-like enzyme